MPNAALKRGLIAAALLVFLAQVSEGQPTNQSNDAEQATEERSQPEPPALRGVGGVQGVEPPAPDPRQAAQDERDERDLQAQRNMALAAFLSVGVGCLGLLGLGATVYFARNAWREAERGADAAARAADLSAQANADARAFFAAERRPWIEIIPMETTIVAGEQHAKVAYILSNIGLSPALNVGVNLPEAFADQRLPSFMDLRRRMQESEPRHAVGPFIFPQKVRHGEVLVPLNGLNQAKLISPIYLEGFVEYQSRNGAPFFFTPFVWVLKFSRDGGWDGSPAAERIDVSYFSPAPT